MESYSAQVQNTPGDGPGVFFIFPDIDWVIN